jgi:ABC-2 type transport system permease protein
MLRTTLFHDGLSLLRDRGSWLLMLLLIASLSLASWSGTRWMEQTRTQQAQLGAQDEQLRQQTAVDAERLQREGGVVSQFRDPRIADVVGRRLAIQHAQLPPLPLAALTMGQADLLPAYQAVSLDAREDLLSESELTPPKRLATGRFDVGFVLVFLLPLLVIGLCHSLPAWEREQGLLRLLLVQRPRLNSWLATRYALRLGVLTLPLALCGIGMALIHGLDTATAQRLLAWLLVATTYIGFWGALCWWVGSRTRNAAQSLLWLSGAWLLLVVVIPAGANLLIEMRHPVPQRIVFVDTMRDATDHVRAQGSQLLADYLEDHPEMAIGEVDPQNFFAQRFVVQMRVEQALQPLADRFEAQRRARADSVAWLRFLSPAVLAAEGLAEAAGTGESRHAHFSAQVDAFHQRWRRFFEPHILSRQAFMSHERIPRFQYTEERLASVWQRLLPILLGLLLPALILVLVAVRREPSPA